MPRQIVSKTGRGTVTLVVKRIKGRLYVYDEYRANGKVHTFYIGPLEEMAQVYQIYKSLGKAEKLTKRDLRRLARILLEEYMKKMSVVNSKRTGRVVAGPPGFEPGVSGSEGPGFINDVSSRNHQLETLFTADYRQRFQYR